MQDGPGARNKFTSKTQVHNALVYGSKRSGFWCIGLGWNQYQLLYDRFIERIHFTHISHPVKVYKSMLFSVFTVTQPITQ